MTISMMEQAKLRNQFLALQKKFQGSHQFIVGINALVSEIKAKKQKKKSYLAHRIPSSLTKFKKTQNLQNILLQAENQLQIQLMQQENLQRLFSDQIKMISKYKTQNAYLEQELSFYKKNEGAITNINNLMTREVSSLNQKIVYYNKEINETWGNFIRKGSIKKIEQSTAEQKKPSLIIKVQQQKRKPRVTFPEYFAEKSFNESSSDESEKQNSQKQISIQRKTLPEQLFQPVIEEPESPSLSKYQLKSILSCITSIHNLPSTIDSWSLTKQEISIYTKSKIMQYFKISLPYPPSYLSSLVIQKYTSLLQNVQHLQQQYILYQESKKQLSQKLSLLETNKTSIFLKPRSKRLSKKGEQSQTNTITIIVVTMQRLVSRFAGILSSMLGVIKLQNSLFSEMREKTHKIQEEIANHKEDQILLFEKQNQSQRSILNFYFSKYLQIIQILKAGDQFIRQEGKAFRINCDRKNLETYYIETPDYYRFDNFRLLQKMEKKNFRNILSTARLERKGSSRHKEETIKTEVQTQRMMVNLSLQRIKTVRQFRSTVSTQNRNRLQKTQSKALNLSNIVQKINRLNLSSVRRSK